MTPSQRAEKSPEQNEINAKEEKTKRIPYHFGEKLRHAREHKGYTLKVVAMRAGVSESLVSQIERNHVSPAIDTLLALADVLDLNLEYLFEEYRKEKPVHIIRADERPVMAEEDTTYEELAGHSSSGNESTIESYIVKIPAGSQTHRGSYGHLGREIGIVLKGQATLIYEGNEYILNEGDSVSFAANASHTLENCSDTDLEAIWFVTPAQRFIK
ncbi:MAG: helix-turn-helix domain-containing protein [Treponema sp.]|nr:helix-turn-helix domain-containing protein [Treponema sp.]